MGKYAALTRYLREQEQPRITLRFAELEEILGFSLPESAYKYPAWWANSAKGQSQVKGWREAGWETRDVDLRGRKVTFVRIGAAPVGRPDEAAAAHSRKARAETGKPHAGATVMTTQAAGNAAVPAAALDVTKLPPGARRLLESRAARHGRAAAAEAAAILQQALAEERRQLLRELAEMRGRTERAGAFDLLDVLGRK